MPSQGRLRSSRDIRSVFDARNAKGARTLVTHCGPAPDGETSVAVVASRKVGNAVRRNRAKRRLRAAVRQVELPTGLHVVVTARPELVEAPFDRIVTDLRATLRGVAR